VLIIWKGIPYATQEAEFKAQMEEDEEILRHGFTK
jgi:hypothetical protein